MMFKFYKVIPTLRALEPSCGMFAGEPVSGQTV